MSDGEEQAVREAAEQFYAALNAMLAGDASAMADVWSHADDVTYMGPTGGVRVGWAQVRASWEEQAALKLGGEVKPTGLRVIVGRDLAVTSSLERGANVGAEGEPLAVSIRETNVYRKESGTWKLIGVHTDLLPFLMK